MTSAELPSPPLVAVDIGNSRIKFGLYARRRDAALPAPDSLLDFSPGREPFDRLADWLTANGQQAAALEWRIGSVSRPRTTQLVDWLRSRAQDRIVLLSSQDVPLRVDLPRPDMVGIDRLLGAVAVNRVRPNGRAAVVVDLGTAITVDLVATDGSFQGGAILPGIGMSARAFHQCTDLLPLIDMADLDGPPDPLGKSTVAAMTAGLYWGAVGGVRELVARYSQTLEKPPLVVLTGGAANAVARLIAPEAMFVPHLILAGIAAVAGRPEG